MVQPVLWAVMVSLARLWQSVGVVVDAVMGHSQGEIAAACVAGALSLRDAAAVVALRVSWWGARLAGGAMVSWRVGWSGSSSWMADWGQRLDIAAVNGVSSVVVCGDVGAVEELMARCEAEGCGRGASMSITHRIRRE